MRNGFLELVGVLIVILGGCVIVGAAALVSVALAVLAAGVFLIFGGVVTVYVATVLDKTPAGKPGERP